ncbi:MAG: substrate-binding domain-containing protein [Candidatus Limnocylindrales bacterium]
MAVASGDILAEASGRIGSQGGSASLWSGPASGPSRARDNGLVVFVAGDMSNGGIEAVADGVRQAAEAMGWTVAVRDGRGRSEDRGVALQAAVAARPLGIVIGGFDPSEQIDLIHQARDLGIPLVGWHAGTQPGPDPAALLFTNVSTRPAEVALLAADYVINDSHGTAGVAIFTDSQYQIALDKADLMKAEVERCAGCTVLAYRDSPIAEIAARMPNLVTDLRRRFGTTLSYLLAVNGNYFTGTRLGLIPAGVGGTDPPFAVAAGDGDQNEFDRIRKGDYQKASVAEPLYLQGWQIVDELNRALAGQGPSTFVAPPGLITVLSVPPPGSVWDPSSSYRTTYRGIWGVGS